MMGLTAVQSKCLAFLVTHRNANGVMPSFREIKDHMGFASMGRAHALVVTMEERGAVRRLSRKARAIEILDADSLRAVLLTHDTYRLVEIHAASQGVETSAAAELLLRERLGVAA